MKPIELAELSAFLDGELDSVRTSEVEAALASDSALREEFNTLASVDAEWRSVARTAVFAPNVQLSRNAVFAGPWLLTVAVVVVLAAVRFVPKFIDVPEFGFLLHGLTLALVVAWVTRIAQSNVMAETASIS